ncbi:MAG: hypothetical protein KIT84_35560 [Labilithrix sp.]|nr:hypothetical protein [Labilithrix sp.]MCW5816370.1 hypothetical protein [Labilithrix sp.]
MRDRSGGGDTRGVFEERCALEQCGVDVLALMMVLREQAERGAHGDIVSVAESGELARCLRPRAFVALEMCVLGDRLLATVAGAPLQLGVGER